jgi:hypothetical protein
MEQSRHALKCLSFVAGMAAAAMFAYTLRKRRTSFQKAFGLV